MEQIKFVLDGSNLANLDRTKRTSLDILETVWKELRTVYPGCELVTMVDAGLRHIVDRDRFEKLLASGDIFQTPAHENGDIYILRVARKLGAMVVTTDLYRDHPEERAGIPFVRCMIAAGQAVLGDPAVYKTPRSRRPVPVYLPDARAGGARPEKSGEQPEAPKKGREPGRGRSAKAVPDRPEESVRAGPAQSADDMPGRTPRGRKPAAGPRSRGGRRGAKPADSVPQAPPDSSREGPAVRPDAEPGQKETSSSRPAWAPGKYSITGFLSVLPDGSACIRPHWDKKSEGDMYLARAQVETWGLRAGDAIDALIHVPEGETTGPIVEEIRSLNGRIYDASVPRKAFSELGPLIFSGQRLRLERHPEHFAFRFVDLFAPIGKGQNVVIVSERHFADSMFPEIITTLEANHPDMRILALFLNELVPRGQWRPEAGRLSLLDRPIEQKALVVDMMMARSRRLVELGHDVVMVVDSLNELGRVLLGAYEKHPDAEVGSWTSMLPLRRCMEMPREVEGGGSFTLIGGIRPYNDRQFDLDQAIFSLCLECSAVEIYLEYHRMLGPVLDVRRSGNRREQQLWGPVELAKINVLRRVMAPLDAIDAANFLNEKLLLAGTNERLLDALVYP